MNKKDEPEEQEIIEELHGNVERASVKIFEDFHPRSLYPKERIEVLTARFKERGEPEPLEVDEYYEPVGREINLLAAREAGFECIPVLKRKRPKKIVNFPRKILVEVSNKCNLECVMCPAHGPTKDMKREKVNMSFDLFKKVIDEVSEHEGVDLLFHFYGEPLLNPDLTRFFDYLKTKKTLGHLLMSTNGTILGKRQRGFLLASPLHVLQISLNALEGETYKQITGGFDQDRLLANVEAFIKERDERGQKSPFLRVQMVEMDCNEKEIKGFIQHWEGVADLIHVNSFEKQGGRVIDQRQNKDGIPKGRFFCDRLRRRDFVIYSNGLMTVCVYDYDGILALGNVQERRIAELMDSEKYEALLKAHQEGDLSPFPLCEACTDWMF